MIHHINVISALDQDHHKFHDEMRRSKHFWHSVCGLRSTSEELMSEAIMLDCIRTYGMSQSDRNNNIVNRLGNIDKAEKAVIEATKKEMMNKMKHRRKEQLLERKRRLKSDPLLGTTFRVGFYVERTLSKVLIRESYLKKKHLMS